MFLSLLLSLSNLGEGRSERSALVLRVVRGAGEVHLCFCVVSLYYFFYCRVFFFYFWRLLLCLRGLVYRRSPSRRFYYLVSFPFLSGSKSRTHFVIYYYFFFYTFAKLVIFIVFILSILVLGLVEIRKSIGHLVPIVLCNFLSSILWSKGIQLPSIFIRSPKVIDISEPQGLVLEIFSFAALVYIGRLLFRQLLFALDCWVGIWLDLSSLVLYIRHWAFLRKAKGTLLTFWLGCLS